jgi:hypothetical protein
MNRMRTIGSRKICDTSDSDASHFRGIPAEAREAENAILQQVARKKWLLR